MTISYVDAFKLWWPDWDVKAEKNHNYILKNLPTMDFAISQCQERRVCVQAGGHVGIWPIHLINFFGQVHTFEPDPDLWECLSKNADSRLPDTDFVEIYDDALSNYVGLGGFKRSTSSGSNALDGEGCFSVSVIKLDSLCLEICDALFLDVEQHERFAILGALETIHRCRPVIQLEELGEPDEVIHDALTELRYKRHPEKQGKDVVYLPC